MFANIAPAKFVAKNKYVNFADITWLIVIYIIG